MLDDKKLSEKQIEVEFLEMCFDIEAELIEKGYLHPDGSIKTLGNANQIRLLKETCH